MGGFNFEVQQRLTSGEGKPSCYFWNSRMLHNCVSFQGMNGKVSFIFNAL